MLLDEIVLRKTLVESVEPSGRGAIPDLHFVDRLGVADQGIAVVDLVGGLEVAELFVHELVGAGSDLKSNSCDVLPALFVR